MPVRIYKPARNAMQSGKGKSDYWVLEHEPTAPRTADPLMGWTSSADTRQQVKLTFDTQGRGHRLCRARGPGLHRDAGSPRRQGDPQILFRQFQVRPHRQLDALRP